MAARLLSAGYEVYGKERDREHARALEEAGLRWRDTPREVAEAAEVVFTSLPDDEALEAAASGPDGILAGLAAGKVWVDVSTVSPRVSRELAERARERGAAMLDAPVSGSVPQAQSGTLTIMVGGDDEAYRRVEPVLRELGTPDARRRERPGTRCSSSRSTSASPCRCSPSAKACCSPSAAASTRASRRRGDDREPDRLADAARRAPRSSSTFPTRRGSTSSLMHKDIRSRSRWRESSTSRSRRPRRRRGAHEGASARLRAARHRVALQALGQRPGGNERVRRPVSRSGEAGRAARKPTRRSSRPPPSFCSSGSRGGEHGRGRRTRRGEQGHDLPLVAEQGDARPRRALPRVGHRPARPPETGSLRADLLALLRPWVRRVRKRPYGRVIAGLVAEAQTDPGSPERTATLRRAPPRARPARSSDARSSAASSRRRSTSSSRSTSSTARSTTASSTATHLSTTASSATSSTPSSPASASTRGEQGWRRSRLPQDLAQARMPETSRRD